MRWHTIKVTTYRSAAESLMLRLMKVKMADLLMAAVPRRIPDKTALQKCKIISHRGEHDNVAVRENTLSAFALARNAGVWGIECDIRWTADLCPVICHDPDTQRVFGDNLQINQVTFSELRSNIPQIPSLEELLAEFGGNTHLMLEIKREPFPQAEKQKFILQQKLSTLRPCDDYHILALDARLFDMVDFLPRRSCVAVAEDNMPAMSQEVLERGLGALTGHFVLLNNGIKKRHENVGQKVGTGFVRSRNCLFRELNRGVEWIFSNDAVKLQRIVHEYLEKCE